MKDWLPIAQRLVDEARKNGTVGVRYNDLIDAIAVALREASNPVNISDHDPWMHRLATRLADIDIRMSAVEDYIALLETGAKETVEKFKAMRETT